jgi:hypothetical protein
MDEVPRLAHIRLEDLRVQLQSGSHEEGEVRVDADLLVSLRIVDLLRLKNLELSLLDSGSLEMSLTRFYRGPTVFKFKEDLFCDSAFGWINYLFNLMVCFR